MSEDTVLTIEVPGATQPPSLSEASIADYNRLLGDPAFQRDHPAHFAALKASVDQALAATGQNQPPPVDPRTPAQRLYDQQRGVAFDPAGKVPLPDYLADTIKPNAGAPAPDPAHVAKQLAAAGLDPKTVLADAALAIAKAGGEAAQLGQLGAHSLAQLAIWGAYLRKHAASRPQ